MVFAQKASAFLLDNKIKSPEIAAVLVIGIGFVRVIDDPKMHPMRVRRLHSREIEQLESGGLEHAMFPAMSVLSLLDASAQVELAPGNAIGSAEIIARFEFV